MRLKRLHIINEKLSSFRYEIPSDPKKWLFDFYLLVSLSHTGDDDIDYSLDETRERRHSCNVMRVGEIY